ncbi:MAG: leucine-rich repeat protein [Anaeroplasmataceae bacterium]
MSDIKYAIIEENDLTEIGNAIREKESTSELIPTKEMPARIRAIETGSNPTATISITENGTYDVASYGTAIVDIQQTQAPASDLDKLIDGTITSFALPVGVTKIADYKFYKHTSLTEAVLTGLVTIGQYAFSGCTGLKEIVIPSTVTTVNSYAFDGCSKVESIVVNNKTLGSYQFRNNYLVNSLSLNPEISSIPMYCFQYCGRDGTGFELNIPNVTSLSSYAFQYSAVKKIEGSVGYGAYSFMGCTKLETIDIEVYNYLDMGMFRGCTSLKNIKLKSENTSFSFQDSTLRDCTSVENFDIADVLYVTNIYSYAFQNFGSARSTVDTDRLILDFAKYSFTTVNSYSFSGLKNTNVVLPSTITTINSNAFRDCNKLNLYLNSCPTLSNVSAFDNNINLNIFIDFDSIDTLVAKTNWTAYQENVKGVITGVSELPLTTTSGIDVLWYYDSEFTQLVGSGVVEETATYYCKIGPAYLTLLSGINCSIIVSDANDNVYNEGDPIVLGTILDFAFQPIDGQEIPLKVAINDVTIDLTDFSDYMSNYIMEGNLSIKAIYWDGVIPPLNETFADNDWDVIALGIKTRTGFDVGWKVGDTKSITTTDGKTYILRICDTTPNRYPYADGSGNSQAVIEFVEGLPDQMALNDSVKENDYWTGGGWALTDMNNIKLPNFLATLPQELQNVISEVSLTCYSVTEPSTRIATSKLFIGNEYEILGAKQHGSQIDQAIQFELYKQKGYAAMQKYRLGSTSSEYFWLRSPIENNSLYFSTWRGSSIKIEATYGQYGVAPIFAI